MHWSAVSLVASLGVLIAGCGKGVFCSKCEATPAPEPPPTEIAWTGLAEELNKVDFADDLTVHVDSVKVVVEPGEDAWNIRVANWQDLVSKLGEREKRHAKQAEHYALMYRLHTMLAERQPPVTRNYWIWSPTPPLGQCPVDLPVFVFFPEEAQFDDWRKGHYHSCPPQSGCPEESERWCEEKSAPVCPNRDFYDDYVDRYLGYLEKCEGGRKTLRVRGFASSSGISPSQKGLQELQRAFERRSVPSSCGEIASPAVADPSEMFNLLVSDRRAHNVLEMLTAVAQDRGVSIGGEVATWCSYGDMAKERVDDGKWGPYDSSTGMFNRRAKITVVP